MVQKIQPRETRDEYVNDEGGNVKCETFLLVFNESIFEKPSSGNITSIRDFFNFLVEFLSMV